MAERKKHRSLTEEEIAESMARFAEYNRTYLGRPEDPSRPIEDPEKFGGPIGADADGNIRTYDRAEDVPD